MSISNCGECGGEALPAPLHVGTVTGWYCRSCAQRLVAGWVAEHRSDAETVGRSVGVEWSGVTAEDVADQLVARLLTLEVQMRGATP